MRKVSIVVIGDEILLGRVADTNSGFIARAADAAGWRIVSIRTAGDSGADIRAAVDNAMSESDIVFTTGGLGPTKDDITKSVLLDIFGGQPVLNADVAADIEQLFAARGLRMNPLTAEQAVVPSSARIIRNRFGTAPIMLFESSGRRLVAMPGVPSEMEGMLPEVMDLLKDAESDNAEKVRHSTRMVSGMTESDLAGALAAYEDTLPRNYKLAYLPDSPLIKLRLDCYGDDSRFDFFTGALDEILFRLDELYIYTHGDKTIGKIVIENLRINGLTLATAESCTGGNIARVVTSEAGASEVYTGGVVSYDNSVKTGVLGVDPAVLEQHGAVSGQVVEQMAEGVCRVLGTSCSVATSGIAGPGGGTVDKPVGMVWIAVKTRRGVHSKCFKFRGKRGDIIRSASTAALLMLLRNI